MTESAPTADYVVACPRCDAVFRVTWGSRPGPQFRMDCWSCGAALDARYAHSGGQTETLGNGAP